MVSVLAQQLRKIREEDRQVRGITAGQNKRPSFLFDEREAADYDDEAIFSLAQDGLRELEVVDGRFSGIQETLFAPKLVNLDLTTMVKSERMEYNTAIGEFLMLISPHFMRPAAHKVLEWMVRKWRVNETHLDELFTSILPYHDTLPFVRMVQIVYFPEDSRWVFLYERSKQNGHSISRTLLAQRCAVDGSILDCVLQGFTQICSKLEANSRYHQYAEKYISFTTFILLETLMVPSQLKDIEAIKMFQRLELMISTDKCPEGLVGAMMIFLQLCERANFSELAINHFVDKIVKNCTPSIERNVILTVARVIEAGYLEKLEPITVTAINIMSKSVLDEVVREIEPTRFLSMLTLK